MRAARLAMGVPAVTVGPPDICARRHRRAQLEACHAHRYIEAGLAFEAERLQRQGIVRSPDERVGVAAYADSRTGGDARIIPGKIARTDPARRREHRPGERRLRSETDVEPDPLHERVVRISCAVIRMEPALQLAHRADHEARAAAAAALENSGLNAGLGGSRRG